MKSRLLVLVVVLLVPPSCGAGETLHAGKPLAFWLKELENSDPLLREEAILVLTDAGPEARAAVSRLEALAKDEQRGVRLRAGLALWRIAGQKQPAIAALTEAVRDLATPDRMRLLFTLTDFGPDAVASAPAVLELMDDADRVFATQAAQLLPKLGSGVVPVLMAALEHEKPRRRRNAAEVLARMGPFAPEASPALRRGLRDDDKLVRTNCARALWSQGQTTETVVAVLLDAVRTGTNAQRRDVLQTVGYSHRSARGVPILKELLKSGDVSSRVRAAIVLWEFDPQPELVLPIYLQGLKDANNLTRMQAARGLARLGPAAREALPALIALLKTPGVGFPPEAHEVLARIGAPAVPPLIELLTADKFDARAAAAVTNALGRIGAPAVPAILPLLDHKEFRVRGAACQIVAAIGPPAKDAVPQLIALLKDSNVRIRQSAILALGRMGAAAKPATTALIALARDKASSLRSNSFIALQQIHADPKVVRPIALAALQDNRLDVRCRALSLLWHVDPRHPDIMPKMLEWLEQKEARPQLLALLGQMGPEAAPATPALVKLLSDRNWNARNSVIYVLERIGPAAKEAVPTLIERLREGNVSVRYPVLRALQAIASDDSARIVPAVLEVAKQDHTDVRTLCLNLLAGHGPKAAAAVPWLVEELHGPPGYFTTPIVETLNKIDPSRTRKEALPVLRGMLTSSSPFHFQAAEMLLRLQPDNKEALAVLIEGLRDLHVPNRQRASQSLAALGSAARSAAPALRRALRDSAVLVRIHAAAALYKVTGETETTMPVLVEALKPSPEGTNVRRQAAELLGDMGLDAKAALPALRELREEADLIVRGAVLAAIGKIAPPPPPPADKEPDR